MKTKLAIIFLLILLTNFAICQTSFTHKESGVKVNFKTSDKMFPESWRGGSINGEAESLTAEEYKRSQKIISEAMDKYPSEVLQENLKEVYILNSLKFYNQIYGGTNSNDIVYICNSGRENGYSDEYFEQLFHAEFSSILLRNYSDKIFEERWESVNKEGFTYGSGGVDEIRKGKAGTDYLPEFFEQGFLYQYAMSGMENDFNSISKNLFCPNSSFWTEGYEYERLKLKIILTIDFYRNINSTLDINHFMEFEDKE